MTPDDYFEVELTALRRATKLARSAAGRLVWRAAMKRRSRRVRTALEAAPELVPTVATRRVKRPGAWDVLVDGAAGESITVMTLHIRTPGRLLEELAMPIPLEVHREELVDAARLHQLVQAGVVQVMPVAGSGP